ncbi:hypothetical protein V1525DRAFT_342265 [Lipomyces kononenkoae]|uniref:Uncharacterized protein n=1 Tax=Lipomyces kononenkoae TaxID=34357 RepID=A0ACC3T3H1_LIPKO
MSVKRPNKSSWAEPPPSDPVPGYGGFALGVLPPAKPNKKSGSAAASRVATGTVTPNQGASPDTGADDGTFSLPVTKSKTKKQSVSQSATPINGSTPGSNGNLRRTRSLSKSEYTVNPLTSRDASGEDTEVADADVDEDEIMSDSPPPPKILISKVKGSPGTYNAVKSAELDPSKETKIKLKFQKTFDDYFVRSSLLRPTAKEDSVKEDTSKPPTPVKPSTKKGKASAREQQHTEKELNPRESALTPPPESDFSRVKRAKRVKISPIKIRPVRESVFGFGPSTPDLSGVARSAAATPSDQDDPTRYNDDFCSACGGMGRFLCCEGCPRSFHFTCTDPPYDEDNLPEGSWFCRSCYVKRHPLPLRRRGLFSELMDQMDKRNPSCFSLPRELRERYEGVTTTEFGEYQDVHDLKPRRINRSGFLEEADPYRLTDKNGKSILCYKCGQSALNDRKIISCDYCPLHWHLDCLDPPMSTIPTSARKWMCPNHVGRDLIHRRRKRNSKIINVSIRRGFVNNGDIEVGNDSSDDEQIGPEAENFVKPQLLHFMNGWEESPFERSAYDRRIPTWEFDTEGIVYKLPERGIVLDFIDKINALQPFSRKRTYPLPLNELDRLVERPYMEREFVRNVAYMSQSHMPETVTRQNVSNLIDAAIKINADAKMNGDEMEDVETKGTPPLSPSSELTKASSSQVDSSNSSISTGEPPTFALEDDRESLLAIQKLIRIKGKDALMKFLSA